MKKRGLRVVGLLIPYLLFAYPLAMIAYVFIAAVIGAKFASMDPTGPVSWFFAFPFWMSVLVMLQALPFLLVFDLARLVARNRMAPEACFRYWARGILLVVAGFAVYTPARIALDRGDLRVQRYTAGEGQGTPLRIVFMGDLQRDAHTDDARTSEVIELVNKQKPELILVGGDWINTGPKFIDVAAEAAGSLRAPLGVWSVRGDHDNFAYRDQERSVGEVSAALAKRGVEMVDNQVRRFEHQGKTIGVAFLSYNYIVRSSDAEVERLLHELKGTDYSILLTHQFDSHLAALVKDQVDLVLAAHTHGGQVNPVVGFWHVALARVETRYVAGRYSLGQHTTVIVTSGVGFSIAPFRYASPASIEVIELRP